MSWREVVGFAGAVFKDSLKTNSEPLLSAVGDYASDKVESLIVGKRTIEEWAEIAIQAVDKVRERIAAQENLKYVGGKLCFQISESNHENVIISFQLYYLDENKAWKKVEASSVVLASTFKPEALEDIKANRKIEFDVEG